VQKALLCSVEVVLYLTVWVLLGAGWQYDGLMSKIRKIHLLPEINHLILMIKK
jgi:hypothetical protein